MQTASFGRTQQLVSLVTVRFLMQTASFGRSLDNFVGRDPKSPNSCCLGDCEVLDW